MRHSLRRRLSDRRKSFTGPGPCLYIFTCIFISTNGGEQMQSIMSYRRSYKINQCSWECRKINNESMSVSVLDEYTLRQPRLVFALSQTSHTPVRSPVDLCETLPN